MLNDEIIAIKDTILKTADCEKIYLFGSYANGIPHANSDYDFYVVLNDSVENPLITVEDIFWNLRKVQRKTPVDILADKYSNFEKLAKTSTLEKQIIKEGLKLYDRNE
jgi:predicted nucleotidyltransferase